MDKRHINYLIKMLRQDRSIMRSFWKKLPEAKKQTPNSAAEYKLQGEIIKSLQALKE